MKDRIKYSMIDRIKLQAIKEGCFNIYDKLILSIAWNFKNKNEALNLPDLEVEELYAVGMAAVKTTFLKDINYYRPQRAASLSTIIYSIASNGIIDYLRKNNNNYKASKAYVEGIKTNEKTLEELKDLIDTEIDIKAAKDNLENNKKPYREIINKYYGFEFYHRHTKQELAKQYNCSPTTITNWIRKGLDELEQPLNNYGEEREGIRNKKYM